MKSNTSSALSMHVLFPAPLPRIRSDRARTIQRWFGLRFPRRRLRERAVLDRYIGAIDLSPGRITLITGPSGAGKSSLLREIVDRRVRPEDRIDLEKLSPPDRPLVDCFENRTLTEVLSLLSRVGLSEAWTFLRRASHLSEGQRFRFKLAMALESESGRVVFCDEFAAVLDRVTACVVAHALRRAISGSNLHAILATSHDDLVAALEPDLHIECDFGRFRAVSPRSVAATARSTPAPQTPPSG